MPDAKRPEPSEFVDAASAITGALAGTAVTLVAGPFAGSASGEAVARVLLRVGSEIEHRLFAPREDRRVAEAFEAAAAASRSKLAAGLEARTDGFFDPPSQAGDSPAVELLEGVLRTAADEWEQRKVPYVGRIFAEVAFDEAIRATEANYLVRLAGRLSYTQLVLLAFWKAAEDSEGPYQREIMYLWAARTEGGAKPPVATIVAEMDDLEASSLLGVETEPDRVVRTGALFASAGGFNETDLTAVRVTELGLTLYRAMGLAQVPEDDLDEVFSAVKGYG